MRRVFHHPTSGGEVDHRLLQISQGTRSVAEFALEFRTLDSEWLGPTSRALRATFHRALSPVLKDELALRNRAPDLESLIDIAIRVDNRIRKRRRERQGKRARNDHKLHPSAYFSRRLSPAERNYDIGNRELLAVKLALEEWKQWLEGAKHPFLIWTDHRNLTYIREAKRLNSQVEGKPEPILSSSKVVASVQWGIETAVKRAQQQHPTQDPEVRVPAAAQLVQRCQRTWLRARAALLRATQQQQSNLSVHDLGVSDHKAISMELPALSPPPHTLLDRHAPVKSRTVTFKRSAPWYTRELRLRKRTRRVLEQCFKDSGLAVHKLAYREHQRAYSKSLSDTRSWFYSHIINNSPANYRPISNLPFLSKVLEKYKTALVRVTNDLLMTADASSPSLLILLDLTAAFDTMDHHILLHRLHSSIGLSDTALAWFTSYHMDRTEYVSLGAAKPDTHSVTCGVPQGSVLGPTLFTLYMLPLGHVISQHGISFHCYADDTQLYIKTNPTPSAALSTLSTCLEEINMWMVANFLQLNSSKMEAILVGTPHHHQYHLLRPRHPPLILSHKPRC
ncbi:hypothetical protein PO909_031744 [Leuciscus waleckii]